MAAEFEVVEPDPSALIESLRSFGYSVESSIADLLDNSISARAGSAWVDFDWTGEDSTVSVIDDGHGMDAETLRGAMRPGSLSPLASREEEDLGRFGLGLKTASFAQARRLTVGSRLRGGDISVRCWDLDHVGQTGEWQLLKSAEPRAQAVIDRLWALDSGTAVVWELLDRMVDDRPADDEGATRHFYETVGTVERHLSMVFHRFLSARDGLNLYINDQIVEPWDPFMTGEKATQRLPVENLKLPSGIVRVEPFVLPHHSRISSESHREGAGPKGWNAHQGYYIYRADRLLVAGDWLTPRLKAEEHYKLARIAIDLTQQMDHDWDIDVRKSRARPPAALRDDLLRVGRAVRKRAAEVYRHRGKRISKRASVKEPVQVWHSHRNEGMVTYRVNRGHDVVKSAIAGPREHQQRIRALIELIERTVPVPAIAIDAYERPDEQGDADAANLSPDLVRAALELYEKHLEAGESPLTASARVLTLEPFANHPELAAALGDQP